MKNLRSILLASILAMTPSCMNLNKPFVPFETNISEKELVKTKAQVVSNAKKYNFPVYILKKNGETVSYYTEGTVVTNRENIGKTEFGYECTDNFWLFDDDIYNGIRKFNSDYSAERLER